MQSRRTATRLLAYYFPGLCAPTALSVNPETAGRRAVRHPRRASRLCRGLPQRPDNRPRSDPRSPLWCKPWSGGPGPRLGRRAAPLQSRPQRQPGPPESPLVTLRRVSIGTDATCVEIKILRRVRAESSRRSPRHRRDACSMAWRCWFLTARRSHHGAVHPSHWLISTQDATTSSRRPGSRRRTPTPERRSRCSSARRFCPAARPR